jgi:predicted DNA-binding transcriptional regulator YafY
MAQSERLHKLERWIKAGCLKPADASSRLEVSRSTLNRDIAFLRDRLGMPVVFDHERGGWVFGPAGAGHPASFELQGLWFSADEAHALITMQQLLASQDAGGLLAPHVQPLMGRLRQILGRHSPADADVARRVRVLTVGARRMQLPHFQAVATALLQRKRLAIGYRGRSRGDATEREVSPQRLVHYRDNWYLDAWCHWRCALRSFSVDAITQVKVLEARCDDVSDARIDEELGAGYGIFAGREVRWATLRFTPERARWVAAERWHRDQRGRWDAQGRWLLDLPFTDPRELVMDILRHVPEVEVIGPQELHDEVLRRLRTALHMHGVLDE